MIREKAIRFLLNRDLMDENLPAGEVLLDYLRNKRLLGIKPGCREGDCGSCMVLIGTLSDSSLRYRPVNSCLLPMGSLNGSHVVTIEGLNGDVLNPIQKALVDEGAIQCGYCIPGLVISITAFLLNADVSDESAALDSVGGNLCRCTGYTGLKRAISSLCSKIAGRNPFSARLKEMVEWKIVPEYFLEVQNQLTRCSIALYESTQKNESVMVAGGTDLFVKKPDLLLEEALFFIGEESELKGIRIEKNKVIVGASTTIEELRTNSTMQSFYAQIKEDLKLICSNALRQQATVGGNLVNASPIGDISVLFLALKADLKLILESRERQLSLKQFYKAYKLVDLRDQERLVEIHFEFPGPTAQFSFEKVSKRIHLDIASVNSAMLVEMHNDRIEKVHLSAGGVAPVPLYLSKACSFLRGKIVEPETIRKANEIAQDEISPLSDLRGSEKYKRLLLRQLIYAHFIKLFPHYSGLRKLI